MAKDKEKKAAHGKTYYAANRENIKKRQAAYAATHRKEIKRYLAEYYVRNQEVIKLRSASWRTAHREELKLYLSAYGKKRRAADLKKERANAAAKMKKWRADNPERAKELKRATISRLTPGYVVGLIKAGSPIARSQIPEDIIKLKREQLQISRATKQLVSTIKEIQHGT
jgi:hypothetical protein